MTKTKHHDRWLATLKLAAVILGAPLLAATAAPGPDKADTTVTSTPGTAAAAPSTVDKPAPARTPPPSTGKRETYPFRGKVASFDTTLRALKLEGKTSSRMVQLTAQTRLTKQGQPAKMEDLKAGEEVGGTLRKTPEGREEAVLIRIGPKTPTEDVRESNNDAPPPTDAAGAE
ncbi:MAG: hypothetical protein JNL97_04400 [Verrucomicrobiales bacterium]|nr:hypothetical protein [Verrucomicrobiales bacterium]